MEKSLIDRWALFPNGVFFVNEKNPLASLDELINRIFSAPTVDAVEIVRCRDCKYWWHANEMCIHPKYVTGRVVVVEAQKDHFCGYGERKEK